MISNRTLATRKRLPRARGRIVIDCGGFSELALYGEWRTSAKQYAQLGRRYVEEIGNVDWLASQDLMCEPFMLEKTGLSVRAHQRITVASYLELCDRAPDLPWLPVLQGWQPDDYLRHVDMYAAAGINLPAISVVGVGSICRRQRLAEAAYTIRRLCAQGLRLHGFGVKTSGLPRLSAYLHSADSMAWGNRALNASERGRSPTGEPYRCPAGSGRTHTAKTGCANCLAYALDWRERLIGKIASYGPLFEGAA
jgi:hypothetical protein